MIVVEETLNKKWNWWPLFPLYPYGKKKTILRELIPDQIWSLEQIQGLYYVAVPIRMTVIKVDDGLMLINPLPPTKELINELEKLIAIHGNVKTIILPSASGLEHKIGLPALSRIFKDAEIWLCPGQWSFPINLPLDFLGIPSKRSRILFEEGTPHANSFKWSSLGPLNLGLGRYQEISCFQYPTKTLHVTDAIIGIDSTPPEIFNFDPRHAKTVGINVLFLHYLLLTCLSLAAVVGLQSVGIILVVAMLITPGATAYLLTDKFDNMTIISVLSAIISSLIGIYISFWFDLETGGSIVLAQTFIFLFAFLFAPRYGIFKLKKLFAGYK